MQAFCVRALERSPDFEEQQISVFWSSACPTHVLHLFVLRCESHICFLTYSSISLQELPVAGEIREAYGHQCIPQIISSLEQKPDNILCIHILTSLLSTQELKVQAIRQGAPALLVSCLRPNSAQLTRSACKCLTQITRLKKGWQAVVDNCGIEALVSVLLDAPAEASECLKQISQTLEGSRAILARSQDVLMQLVKSCQVCR
jgi:hypothetical protein